MTGLLRVYSAEELFDAVETLTQGMTGSLGGDISYTLEHFPNHHRALASMARLGLRLKSAQPVGARYTVSCFFERAIAFAPHDVTARMVYGNYLLAMGQDATALEQLDAASRLGISMSAIDDVLYSAYGQRFVSTIFTQTNQYRVVLEAHASTDVGIQSLAQLYVTNAAGEAVPLSTIAQFSERVGDLLIHRQDQFPAAVVYFGV